MVDSFPYVAKLLNNKATFDTLNLDSAIVCGHASGVINTWYKFYGTGGCMDAFVLGINAGTQGTGTEQTIYESGMDKGPTTRTKSESET
jgi:hypothetical protein